MTYFKVSKSRSIATILQAMAIFALGGSAFAQEAEKAAQSQPPPIVLDSRAPASLIQTFAPIGLLAEFNSNENQAGFTARLGTYSAHQSASNATGITAGYRDSINSWAFPVKFMLPLSEGDDFYLKFGLSEASTNALGGNLTESDSHSLSGQLGLNYRPNPSLVLGLGLVAGQTKLDFRHNGGSSETDYLGLQLEYMHRLSDAAGLAARMIWSRGDNDTLIPSRNSAQPSAFKQDFERIYVEVSALTDLPARAIPILPKSVKLRPIATVMYQHTSFAETVDSLGKNRPGSSEALGIIRLALRMEKEERRKWRLIPYLVAGIEHEFVNSVSRVDHDPANTYFKAGLGMNVGGKGRVDLYFVRRDSFKGTYNSNQLTLFASLLF